MASTKVADRQLLTPPGAGGGPTRVKLAGTVTNNNATLNTLQDVTALQFPVVAGTAYKFKFVIFYTAQAATTGSRWTLNGPALTYLRYRSEYTLTATSRTFNEALNAYNSPAASNASSIISPAPNMAIVEGEIKCSADGNVIARFASEIANSAIIALEDSYVEYEAV